MTKQNFTSINVILDGSGSMGPLVNDTIGGFNSFLAEQQSVVGEAILSLCIFNNNYKLVYDCLPLTSVAPLNKEIYKANGGTALLDAMGITIDEVGKKLSKMKEEERPSKVLFLIITDGEENSSHLLEEPTKHNKVRSRDVSGEHKLGLCYPLSKIKDMVQLQQNNYKWEFVFMGANIDAFGEADSLGINPSNTLQYTSNPAGTRKLYNDISESATRFRKSGPSGSGFFGNS